MERGAKDSFCSKHYHCFLNLLGQRQPSFISCVSLMILLWTSWDPRQRLLTLLDWNITLPSPYVMSLQFSIHGNLPCFSYGELPVTPFGLPVKWFCKHHYYHSTFMSRAAWGWDPGVQNSAESQSVTCNGFFWLWWKESSRKITTWENVEY